MEMKNNTLNPDMNTEDPMVAVLLSTYNGERYVREQLDSIFSQEGVRVELYVRDDGSEDSTMDILGKYAGRESMHILHDDSGNVGVGESFLRLLDTAVRGGAEYFAFADQDDIWIDDKLITGVDAISSMRESGKSGAILYCSNQYLYVDGVNTGCRFDGRQSTDLISRLQRNMLSGCTFVFNSELARRIVSAGRPDRRIIKYRYHDVWTLLVAITCGEVIYDETPHILYRIHENNVVGVKSPTLSEKLKRLGDLVFKTDRANLRMVTAKELLRLFPDMHPENARVLHLFADYKSGFRNRMRLLLSREVAEECLENKIVFRMKVLLGMV